MMEVDDMDTVKEHFHPMNHRSETDGIDAVEYFYLMNHQTEVRDMNTVDTSMWEDKAVGLKVIEREPDDMVLARHWTGEASSNSMGVGGACKIGCSKYQSTFATQDSNYNSP
jgi:hypothetical protein